MISKGKRRYLVALYTPDGFFYRGNTLCFKMGNVILVNMIPTGPVLPESFTSVSTPPNIAWQRDSILDSNQPIIQPFDSSKPSHWKSYLDDIKLMSQVGRNETMAIHDPRNFEIIDVTPEAQLHWVQKHHLSWDNVIIPNGGV